MKPWLLEVNQSPSFTADTPFDNQLKSNLIKDTLTMMNYFPKQKKKLKDKFVNSFEEEVDLKSMLDARFEKHLNANQGNFIDIMNDRRRNALDFFN